MKGSLLSEFVWARLRVVAKVEISGSHARRFNGFLVLGSSWIYTKHGAMNSLLIGVDAKQAATGENVSVDQVAAAHVGYQPRSS